MDKPVVNERTIDLATPDGPMAVTILSPALGRPRGAVICYMDAFGIRSELSVMCRSYAEAGYTTFLPDLYHRLGRSVRFAVPATADAPLDPAMMSANSATSLDHSICDTAAVLSHATVEMDIGVLPFMTVGYCMGARHALAAAVAFPDRIAATACLHGGRLVTDGPTSPHLLIPRVRGTVYFAFAANDETCPDAHKTLIEETIRRSGITGTTEHFDAHHGWTFPTRWCHDKPAANRVLARVLALLDATQMP